MLTCWAFYQPARVVYWERVTIGSAVQMDEGPFTQTHILHGAWVRELTLTTQLNEYSTQHRRIPGLSLFPGLRTCIWTVRNAHLTMLSDITASLIPLEHLSHLYLSAILIITPSSLRPLTHMLRHLELVGGTLGGADFVELVSLGWPRLETLVLANGRSLAAESGYKISTRLAVTPPSLTTLFLDQFPLALDFMSFFGQLSSLLKLTILNVSNTPAGINEDLLPRLRWLRAPISLVRPMALSCPLEYIHIVGSQRMNDPHFFHFLHGKPLNTLICEYGICLEQLHTLLFDPVLDIKHTVVVKKIIVYPVCVSAYGQPKHLFRG
jgi:hypothetical protein